MVYDNASLLNEAKNAREHAYAPYSNFLVGAALLTSSGKIFHGCNIENAAYGPSNCAERTAFFRAIYEGERDFVKIAIVGSPRNVEPNLLTAPCGVCRQVMMEFCNPEKFTIVMPDGNCGVVEVLLKDLLPFGFGPDNLDKS